MDESQSEPPLVQLEEPAPKAPSTFDHIVPAKNPPALVGYYLAVFSLIPCIALLLGPAAVYFGMKGLRAIKENATMPGKAHAIFAIGFGGLTTLANVTGICALIFNSQYKP